MAVATLAIGMIFIGGTFFTGVHFATLSTERTIATVAADEAFAKVRVYGINLTDPNLATNRLIPFETLNPIASNEFFYPSEKISGEKQYCWSALCRPVDSGSNNRLVQVTVFVSRKIGSGSKYWNPLYPFDMSKGIDRPVALSVDVSLVGVDATGRAVLAIEAGKERWISPGYTIAEDSTGEIYRVIDNGVGLNEIVLDPAKAWPWAVAKVWVVPPAIGHGRGPCIEVYQGEVRF